MEEGNRKPRVGDVVAGLVALNVGRDARGGATSATALAECFGVGIDTTGRVETDNAGVVPLVSAP